MNNLKKLLCLLLSTTAIASMFTITVSAEEVNPPSSYDLRDEGCVTPVKSQGNFGVCWDFAGIAVAESALLKLGLETNIDLSEEAVLWDTCGDALVDGTGWLARDRSKGLYSSTFLSAATSKGLYLESDVPYETDPEKDSYFEENRPASLDNSMPAYRVTGVVYPNVDDRNDIKNTIMKYGAIETGMCISGASKNGSNAYWNNDSSMTNHSIAVVGWDDSYSKENFEKIDGSLPQTDGAWLVKNSELGGGTIDGYLWVSYCDACMFKKVQDEINVPAFAISSMEKVTDKNVQFSNEKYSAVDFEKVTNGTVGAVYDFEKGGSYINSLTFATLDGIGKNYQLYVAELDENGKPATDSSQYIQLASGIIEHNGYITVKPDKPFYTSHKKAAVLLHIDGTASVGICTGVVCVILTRVFSVFSVELSDEQTGCKIENGSVTNITAPKNNKAALVLKINTSDNLMCGDADLNGIVDVNDATLVQRYLAEVEQLDSTQKVNAACGDTAGIIGINSATKIQRYLAGIISSLEK